MNLSKTATTLYVGIALTKFNFLSEKFSEHDLIQEYSVHNIVELTGFAEGQSSFSHIQDRLTRELNQECNYLLEGLLHLS